MVNESPPATGTAAPSMTQVALHGVDPSSTLSRPGRLQALRKTGLLDTGPEEGFDRLTALAAKLLEVPTVLISLTDHGRDFLKSRHGLPPGLESATQLTGRTFCHFVVATHAPVMVEDALQRPELWEIQAIEQFGVRAYAGAPLIDDDGQAIGVFCAVDYKPKLWTDRDGEVLIELAYATMREIKLRTALEEARQLLVAREEMMAVVAHDLRTPLNVVTMYAQLLGREELPAKSANMVERLRRTADGMGKLIKSLLDISQVEAGTLVLNRQPYEAAALVSDAATRHRANAEREGVALVVRSDESLAPLSVDYERVMRVFDSLIDNALKFSRHGDTVEVSARSVPGGVRFGVKDTGAGIRAEDLKGLLNRFWQVKLHDRRGAGFGLAIASGLVDAHGGTMDVTSTEGQGSEFAFTLAFPV